MQVPIYQRQVNQNTVQPTAPSPTAFGTQVNEANQQLGNTVQGLGQLVQQRVLERQEQKDTEQVIASETAYKKEISDLRMKYENRKLSAAYDVTKDFDAEAAKVKNKFLESLPGERQKVVFGQMADAFHNSNIDYMAKYERQETNKSKVNTLNDSAATSAAIIANDPGKLNDETNSIVTKNNVIYKQLGYTQEDISRENDRVKTNLISTSIGSYLQSNQLDKAKQQFEDNKELIFKNNPEGFYKLQDAIEKGDFKLAEDKIKFNISNAANIQDEQSFNSIVSENNKLIDSLNLTDEAKVNLKRQYADVAITEQTNTKINIQKDIDGATKFFAKHQKEMSPDKAADLQIAINEKSFSLKMDSAFKTYQTYKLADGSIDMGRVYKDLESKYSGDELEKAKSEIEGRTADFERVRDSRRNAGVVNGQNVIAGAKNYSEAFSWLKRNKTGYENRDYQSLLNYAQNVFNVDENGNPRGAGSGGKKPQTDLGEYPNIIDKLETGTLTQNDLINLYNIGIKTGYGLSEGDYKSLTKALTSKTVSKRIGIIKNKAMLLYPRNQEKRRQFEYFMFNETLGKSTLETTEFIEKETSKTTIDWSGNYESKKAETWNKDFEKQRESSKLWGIYQNKLGQYYSSLKIGLQKTYGTDQINISHIQKFTDAIGGVNEDTIAAIKYLASNKQSVTPANINKIIKDAKFQEKQNKAKREAEAREYLYGRYEEWKK